MWAVAAGDREYEGDDELGIFRIYARNLRGDIIERGRCLLTLAQADFENSPMEMRVTKKGMVIRPRSGEDSGNVGDGVKNDVATRKGEGN